MAIMSNFRAEDMPGAVKKSETAPEAKAAPKQAVVVPEVVVAAPLVETVDLVDAVEDEESSDVEA